MKTARIIAFVAAVIAFVCAVVALLWTYSTSILTHAVRTGDATTVRRLCLVGVNINLHDNNGKTPLIYAAEAGDVQMAKTLLACGARPDFGYHDPPLMHAAENGHAQVVSLLLEKGADADRKNAFGTTALMLAARNGHLAAVEALLAHGANVNAKDRDGRTALMLAKQQGHPRIITLLKARGAVSGLETNTGSEGPRLSNDNRQPDPEQQYNLPPLVQAAWKGDMEKVALFLKNGVDVNTRADQDGGTAILWQRLRGRPMSSNYFWKTARTSIQGARMMLLR